MSLKGSKTTSDFLKWEEFEKLVLLLNRDKYYQFTSIISIGVFTGLRIKDIMKIRYSDILNGGQFIIKESKTRKDREITINPRLTEIIKETFDCLNVHEDTLVCQNQKTGELLTPQYLNRKLKFFKTKYNLTIKNFSTHSFRKTLGNRIWSNNNFSEKSIVLLSELFNHSNSKVTRRYLGINDEDIKNVYLDL